MLRLLLISIFLITLQQVYGTTVIAPQPTTPAPAPPVPPCDKSLCASWATAKISALLQTVANTCACNACGGKDKVYIDLYKFCEKYREYDPEYAAIIQCIQNKITDPCYSFYKDLRKILADACGTKWQSDNFDIWTFIYNLCWGCAGCLDGCYITNNNGFFYSKAPVIYTQSFPKPGCACKA